MAVIGPSAHVLRNLFGGYSYAAALEASSDTGAGPQALDLDPARALALAAADASGAAALEGRLAALYPQARTVRDAIAARLPGAAVTYAQGCGLSGSDRSGFDAAVRLAKQAEVVILVVGHKEGWHYKSCTIGEGFDNSELLLPGVQEETRGRGRRHRQAHRARQRQPAPPEQSLDRRERAGHPPGLAPRPGWRRGDCGRDLW